MITNNLHPTAILRGVLLLVGLSTPIPITSTNPSNVPSTIASPSISSYPSTSSAPSDRMQFDIVNAATLVENLISSTGNVEISNIKSSSHIEQCASLFRRGHTLGNLYQKDPITNELLKDENGDYILTDTPIVPDEGIILSSGSPQHLNWNDEDDTTLSHNVGGDMDLKRTVDQSNGENNSIFDACILQFHFRFEYFANIVAKQICHIIKPAQNPSVFLPGQSF